MILHMDAIPHPFQSFGRISATLVFQDKVDKPAGRGVVLRPCAKSSITIPREVARKAFEQDARLNNVYKAYSRPISTSSLQNAGRNLHLWSFWYHSRTCYPMHQTPLA